MEEVGRKGTNARCSVCVSVCVYMCEVLCVSLSGVVTVWTYGLAGTDVHMYRCTDSPPSENVCDSSSKYMEEVCMRMWTDSYLDTRLYTWGGL